MSGPASRTCLLPHMAWLCHPAFISHQGKAIKLTRRNLPTFLSFKWKYASMYLKMCVIGIDFIAWQIFKDNEVISIVLYIHSDVDLFRKGGDREREGACKHVSARARHMGRKYEDSSFSWNDVILNYKMILLYLLMERHFCTSFCDCL